MADETEEVLSGYPLHREVQAGEIDQASLAAESEASISDEAMSAWLNSWGTDHEVAPPKVDVIKPK